MDKQKILGRFKDKKAHIPQIALVDGGIVVGTEADEENKLWYVIERQGTLGLERANTVKVRQVIKRREHGSITVPMKKSSKKDE